MMRRDPFQAFNFQVEIEGIVTAGFSECSGLQAEIEALPYAEGGVNEFEHQFWGRTKYPRLVLKRGLTQIDGYGAGIGRSRKAQCSARTARFTC